MESGGDFVDYFGTSKGGEGKDKNGGDNGYRHGFGL
jgi:hypothetical protein